MVKIVSIEKTEVYDADTWPFTVLLQIKYLVLSTFVIDKLFLQPLSPQGTEIV